MEDIIVIDKIEREDFYFTKTWKSEKAFRFVLQYQDGKKVETSVFFHRDSKDEILDLTIEVSTMSGCPVRCKFCDTYKITTVRYLTHHEVISQVKTVLDECGLTPEDYPDFRISFLAIGENSLIPDVVIKAASELKALYKHVVFNLSTVLANVSAIDIWSDANMPLRTLQMSIIHYDIEEINRVIPNIPAFDIGELSNKLLEFKTKNPKCRIRINYVLIEGYNDSMDYVNSLLSRMEELKDIIYFRLSILNETEGTKRHHLKQVSMEQTKKVLSVMKKQGFRAYIFGSIDNQQISCGQFVGAYN